MNTTYDQSAYRQTGYGRADAYDPNRQGFSLRRPLVRTRDWLDERGRPAWFAAMIVGFIAAWPVGLGILGYMIWSNRMFSCRHQGARSGLYPIGRNQFYRAQSTGNAAFDAYRDETLKRLEDEHREFMEYMKRLREARDKTEFDAFLNERREAADRPVTL